jgi:DNA polymerase elongation subunit (family B)
MELGFDGRYAAMDSHETKNYALMSHDGTLTVRGGAFRSARLEPFAEKWLSDVLEALLRDDIAYIRDAYLAQRQAIKDRSVPTRDVSSREKLTKSPAEYQASVRAEPKYEAVLGSGRTSWEAGDRIAVYRADDMSWRLLEEDNDVAAAPYSVKHYLDVLEKMTQRLSKAFDSESFAAVFRPPEQPSLFDPPLDAIETQLRNVVE